MGYKLGLDIGSTTIKMVVLNEQQEIIYKSYERHFSRVKEMALEKVNSLRDLLKGHSLKIAITGSAGIGVAQESGIDFVQEVFATAGAVKRNQPDTDVVIELGGEDAKILFLKGTLEERMNSTCAGGTGAFIDQMAALLDVDLPVLDQLSMNHQKIYPIASRCGVFAKTDIQPLLNQGADKENIAASIFQAVVDQTIAGLAQGRRIGNNVLFLGGPLSFMKGLQLRFIETLNLDENEAHFPALAPYYVAYGAALYSDGLNSHYTYDELQRLLEAVSQKPSQFAGLSPLFADQHSYDAFIQRHRSSSVPRMSIEDYTGPAYLGIDAGSTTTKMVLIDSDYRLLYSDYRNNMGHPVEVVREQLTELYRLMGDRIHIAGSTVTGYGEDLIRHAFHIDNGIVETIAHYTSAKHFNPRVDFIIDIGGQDMKCFTVKDNAIDNMVLNEACSSGCGSFIETFAKSLGYEIAPFAEMGLFAKHPVDLGTRCTVFMNSSVKEAQKNGATVEDISAGLAVSVVKNALYKVIRARSTDDIGQHIVVQGGTFLNDAVLRSFELELGKDVIRPAIAGLMGAFGAAIYSHQQAMGVSMTLTEDQLLTFQHISKALNCNGCTNHCHLTMNSFSDGSKHIAGNRCERPVTGKMQNQSLPDLITYKYSKLISYESRAGHRGDIGIPLALNMLENLPFWQPFLTELGFHVILSGRSSKTVYSKGQQTIPSDTVCYPAKLVHGHIQLLIEKGVQKIFYPCMTYNFDEHISDNCFNCPVVAYYPELIQANVDMNDEVKFLQPFISLNDKQVFVKRITEYFNQQGITVSKREVSQAAEIAYESYAEYKADLVREGQQAIEYAQEHDLHTLIVAGRPYHIDPEINHGINRLLTSLNFVVITEDCLPLQVNETKVNVLNQWTYHARLYQAAAYAIQHPRVELVQLVSFGCGLDAITSDEVSDILRNGNKLYTQIKIDEIDNLGAVKIRLRSLLAAINERERQQYGYA